MSSLQSIGQELKEARLSRGLSLEDVAKATRLSVRHLASLEEGDEQNLPEPFYIKSFIIKYGNFLGLSGVELASRYWVEKKEVPVSHPAKETSQWWLFPVFATVGLVLAVGVAYWFSRQPVKPSHPIQKPVPTLAPAVLATFSTALATPSPTPHPTTSPKVKASPTVRPTLVPTYAPTLAPTPAPSVSVEPATPSAPGGHPLVVSATENCWLLVKADGKVLYNGLLKAGEHPRFSASKSLFIRMGNAGGVRLTLGDQDLGVLGKTGEVVERNFAF